MKPAKPLSIRFNEAERKELDSLKDVFGFSDTFGADAATVKTAITFCSNVVHNLFGDKLNLMFRRKLQQQKVTENENKGSPQPDVIQNNPNNP